MIKRFGSKQLPGINNPIMKSEAQLDTAIAAAGGQPAATNYDVGVQLGVENLVTQHCTRGDWLARAIRRYYSKART